MRWSDQTIEQAIQTAKAKNAIFVVYVEDDSRPTSLHSFIESSDVSSLLMNERFIAIRICSSDQSYRDFVAIYQLVPIPSLFFIGDNGWPLEIISGELPQSAVVQRIRNLLEQSGQHSASTPPTEPQEIFRCLEQSTSQVSSSTTSVTSSISTTSTCLAQQSKEREDVLKRNVNRISPDLETNTPSSSSPRNDNLNLSSPEDIAASRISSSNIPLSERISEAVVSDTSNVKEQEQQKTSGQSSDSQSKPATHPSSSHVKDKSQSEPRHVQEDTMSHSLSSPERAGRSSNIGRVTNAPQPPRPPITGFLASIRGWMQRILQTGRGTTGPKTGRLLNEGSSRCVPGGTARTRIYEPVARLSGDPGNAHIQFRLPDGSTHSASFPTETIIRDVREYVQNNIALPFRDFSLSTSYPRIEFTDEQIDATLVGLGLVPRSVILIIPGIETARPALSSASDALWAVISWPFTSAVSVVNYINFILFGEPQAEISDQSASQQQPRTSQLPTRNQNSSDRNQSNIRRRMPASSVIQREGNVYRLSNRQDDSEDENNTWNGNSTQQM